MSAHGLVSTALVLLIAAASAALAVWWAVAGLLPVAGDEPHYLMIAASVSRDLDFDVSNNYEEDAATGEVYGPVDRHAVWRNGRQWPQHMPGLGVLVSVPFALYHVSGARAGLAVLLVLALGAAVYRWNQTYLRPADAAWLTFGVLACSPVIFGASQLYPDLPAGVAIVACVGWLWNSKRRTWLGWCLYWCTAGFLCWLHVKYYAPSAILGVIGGMRLRRDGIRFMSGASATFTTLYLAGPILFQVYAITAFGNIMGGRGTGELQMDAARAASLVLGLHLDQIHGMFVQQPLLLPGLVALGWMVRRQHVLTLPWLVLYASLVVPNALQQIAYGGHVAPAGRFGWSAMWLWLLPLGIAAQDRDTFFNGSAVRLVVLLGLVYQAVLAFQWVSFPRSLFNAGFQPDDWQPSLFSPAVMLSLPKFGYMEAGYPPNVTAACAALSLFAAGFFWRSRLRWFPAAAVAVLGTLFLPVEDTLDRSHVFPRRYEVENMQGSCNVQFDPEASNGRICQAHRNDRYTTSGPYIRLEAGRYCIVAAVRTLAAGRGAIQIVGNRGERLARRTFHLDPSYDWSYIELEFYAPRNGIRDVEFQGLEFTGIYIDYIDLRRCATSG